MKGKEEVNVNAIANEEVNDVNFVARNNYNPNWKNNGYAPRLPYPNNTGAPIFLMELVIEIPQRKNYWKSKWAE